MNRNPLQCCAICRAIPFMNLPSENEPAISHQSSLQALRVSAVSCVLCDLILQAALEIRRNIENGGGGVGGFISYHGRPYSLSSGGEAVGQTLCGNFSQTGLYAPEVPREDSTSSTSRFQLDDDSSVSPWLFGNWWKRDIPGFPLQLMGLGVRLAATPNIEDAEGNNHEFCYPDEVTRRIIVWRGSYLRIRTEDEVSLGRIIPGRLRLTDTASEAGFRRIQNWIVSCDRDHNCYRFTSPLPTRVLDVGLTSQYIRLVETLGQSGKYVTLSHCWGTSTVISTTFDTIESYKNGILIRDLPRTFRDAVSICRHLQVQYLWIDSLCIIQDCPFDWNQEASRMGNIYAGSYFTLAASSSTQAWGGCLHTWSDRSKTPYISAEACSLGVRTLANAAPLLETRENTSPPSYFGQQQTAFVDVSYEDQIARIFISKEWLPSSHRSSPTSCRIGAFGRKIDPVGHQPLNSRGWTLQERMLSTRILHCTVEQAYWECKWDFVAEDGSVFLKHFLNLDLVLSGQRLPLSEHGLAGVSGMSFVEGYPESSGYWGRQNGGWLAVVESYSRRKLTRSGDKLPALSGLAHYVARTTSDGYYAGLWRGHILEDLHWRVYIREEHRQNIDGGFNPVYGDWLCTAEALAKYRAPSWSWASLDRYIKYVPLDFKHLVAEFIHCHIDPAGNDPFGKVDGGWIKLWAPLVEIFRAGPYIIDRHEPLGFGNLVELHLDHGLSLGEAYFDFEACFPCFGLFLDSQNALVLRPRNTANEYVRIGIAKFLRTKSQREAEPFFIPGTITPRHVPWGPMTENDEKVFVTIV